VNVALVDRPTAMSRPYQKREQTDWAWSQHRGDRVGDVIPASAQRSVRNLKRVLAPKADAVVEVFESERWRDPAADFAWKGSALGKQRALDKLRRMFHPAPVQVKRLGPLGAVLYVAWLEPHGPVLDHQDAAFGQAGIVSRAYALIGAVRGRVLPISLLGLEAPDHALGRLCQRAPNADPVAALNGATEAFLSMDVEQAIALQTDSMVLSAGDAGMFLSNVVFGRTDGFWRIFGRPRTFVRAAQIKPDQIPVAPAADIAKSVLVAGLTLMSRRELPGVESPLSQEVLAELDRDYIMSKEEANT